MYIDISRVDDAHDFHRADSHGSKCRRRDLLDVGIRIVTAFCGNAANLRRFAAAGILQYLYTQSLVLHRKCSPYRIPIY